MPRWSELIDELESSQIRRFFPAEKVLGAIGGIREMKKNVAFDVGAGTGYLTIPLSKIFKKVYAVEISHEMAEKLYEKLKKEGVRNVGIIVSAEPPKIDFKIDLVVFSNALHEMENPKDYLSWAKRADFVLVAEWKKVHSDFGPPVDKRISLNEILEICRGFEILRSFELPFHYVALLKHKKSI
ncbi:MAG: class I SAM-dependent methyltransferase [Archaeoglobi archaeon]|nr:MAG: class I SAM-dependent methyltransferase [Archaeoglobi archaeon]TDA25766.1 MAG: class I SAM-dependent methyltransferase [Archaeoglobi archaeon]